MGGANTRVESKLSCMEYPELFAMITLAIEKLVLSAGCLDTLEVVMILIKILPMFSLTCRKILGSVGRKFILFLSTFYMLISGQICSRRLSFQQNYYKTYHY